MTRPNSISSGLKAAALALSLLLTASPAASDELERARRELQALEATPLPDGEQQGETLAAWRDTINALREEAKWRERAAEFRKLLEEAPATLARHREALSKPIAGPSLPAADLPLADLEDLLARAQAQATRSEQAVQELQAERRGRAGRRLTIPLELSRLQQQIEAAPLATTLQPSPGEPAGLAEARRALAEARRQALEAELRSHQAELSSYEARSELLTLRQDLVVRVANETSAQVQALLQLTNERRSEVAEDAAAAAELTRRKLAAGPPHVQVLASSNEALAAERSELVGKSQALEAEAAALKAETDRIETRRRSVTRRIEAARYSKAVALLMRRHRAELPDLQRQRSALRSMRQASGKSLVRQLELEDERAELTDIESSIRESLELARRQAPASNAELDVLVRELLTDKRRLLDDLYQQHGTYLTQLADVEAARTRLITTAGDYGRFISERLLWLRGSQVVGLRDLRATWRSLTWLSSPGSWRELGSALVERLAERRSELLATLALLLLLVSQRTAWKHVDQIGRALANSRRHRFKQTAVALGWTLLAAATWPAICSWTAWLISGLPAAVELAPTVSTAVARLGQLLLPALVLRVVARPHGLGRAHFRWPAGVLAAVRASWWMLALAVPLLALDAGLEAQDRPEFRDSLGRFAFLAGMILLSLFLHRCLSPSLRPASARTRLGQVLHVAGLSLPLFVAAAAAVGYTLGARDLGGRLLETLAVFFALAVAHALLLRLLVVERRRLQLLEIRKQESSSGQVLEFDGATSESQQVAGEDELDLSTVDTQARHLLRAAAIVTVIVSGWWLWADLLPATRAAERVVLWQSEGEPAAAGPVAPAAVLSVETDPATPSEPPQGSVVTLLDLLVAVGLLVLTLLAAGNLPGLLEIGILRRLELAPGIGYAITTLTRYAITLLGLVWAAGLVGITWGRVQWLAAAVTVGLGFGLQEIFANFVSGLIILFERPIRVGDIVTVGGVEGVVTRIRTRATTISDWDRRELLVPNREFITGQLINWSLTDPVTRVVIPVGIAYGSDTQLATDCLLEVAAAQPLLLTEPKPSVVFRSFGESSLDFQLRVFLPRRDVWPQIVHDLHMQIDARFRELGIEIAFPQRDVHLRSMPDGLGDRVGGDPSGPTAAT